jgi:cardiolipin synthase
LGDYLPHISLFALLDTLVIVLVIPWVVFKKRNATVAVAWCLVVLLVPLLGALLFWAFGYNYLHRRVRRKGSHRLQFRAHHPPASRAATRGAGRGEGGAGGAAAPACPALARVALAVNAFPVCGGNAVTLYHDTTEAFAGMLAAVRAARHHVHVEFFILRSDATAARLVEVLAERAKAGVEVRLLYDSVGGLFLRRRVLRPLLLAGGKVRTSLPVNPLRSWVQVNLRNHRKIVVIDGAVGFTGGMNVGDEYLGLSRRFGHWRDTLVRVEGPGVAGLQRVFAEDWDFAAAEPLSAPAYFPPLEAAGPSAVQVVESGPDQPVNSIREIYFAAILSARKRLWIASPYFVPDAGILDALRLARYREVDVRLLCLLKPDHFLSFWASRYYWADLLAYGVPVYQYARGMMHSKLLLVDGRWAMVGSANLDNRSLHLNFEVGCVLHSPPLVAELEEHFRRDLAASVPVDPEAFARRPFRVKLTENVCRLFSPVL